MFANGMGTYETAYALTGDNVNLVTIRIAALVSGDIYARPNHWKHVSGYFCHHHDRDLGSFASSS